MNRNKHKIFQEDPDKKKRIERIRRLRKSRMERISPAVVKLVPVENVSVKSLASVPISTVKIRSLEVDKVRSIILKDTKVKGDDTAKVYIAKGPEIVNLIDNTNSKIRAMHIRGEIDLSADAF